MEPFQDEAPLDHDEPPAHPFETPPHREAITEEPEPDGEHHDPNMSDVDWIGTANTGGGFVPDDFEWSSNPKQEQEESRH